MGEPVGQRLESYLSGREEWVARAMRLGRVDLVVDDVLAFLAPPRRRYRRWASVRAWRRGRG